MKLIIYRNTPSFLILTSLTIDAVDDANTKNNRLCTMRAKFASNSNERRCFLLNWHSKKGIKKIKFFLNRLISRRQTTTTTKKHQSVVVRRHSNFHSQKNFVHFELFFLRCDQRSQFHLMKWLKSRKRSRRKPIFSQ